MSAAPAVGWSVARASCRVETDDGATVVAALVPVTALVTVSVAVSVLLPAVLNVTPLVKVWTPLSESWNAAFAGRTACESFELKCTVPV